MKCWGSGVLQAVRCIPIASQTYFWFQVASAAAALGSAPGCQLTAALPAWALRPPRFACRAVWLALWNAVGLVYQPLNSLNWCLGLSPASVHHRMRLLTSRDKCIVS